MLTDEIAKLRTALLAMHMAPDAQSQARATGETLSAAIRVCDAEPGNRIPDHLKALPCAIDDDPTSPHYGWLYIPHVDGNWVTAAKLAPFSLAIVENWRQGG